MKIKLFLLLITYSCYAKCQNLDTTRIKNVINSLLIESCEFDENCVKYLLEKPIALKPLKTNNISNILFFETTHLAGRDSFLVNGKYRFIYNPFDVVYVIGYNINNKNIYKLSGFYENNFTAFFADLKNTSVISSDESVFNSKKKFCKTFVVETLNFGDLYDIFIKKKKLNYFDILKKFKVKKALYDGVTW